MNATQPMADIQNCPDTRHIAIDKVGIKDIRYPIRVSERGGGEQRTVAYFNMYVHLPHHFKGTHMSRFVEILNHRERAITPVSFQEMLFEMTALLEAKAGSIEMTFSYFVKKTAPVSGIQSLMDYIVTFLGEIVDNTPTLWIKVVVALSNVR